MSILNYFFIGTGLTFLFDLLFGISYIKNHPSVIDKIWGTKERIICIIMWPLAALVFIIAFIKESFKRLLKK